MSILPHRFQIWSRRSRRLLVVETDIFVLRAAVARARGQDLFIERLTESRAGDNAAALAEALAQLRTPSRPLPRRAVLLTPEAFPAVLELPVPPDKPRPQVQMQELIHWEMEAHLAQDVAASRRIGDILVGRGYLTADQVQGILLELEQRKRDTQTRQPGDRRTVTRFGEIAVEWGLIQREHLDECLALQERIQTVEDNHCYSWSAPVFSTPSSTGKYPWRVCCVNRNIRQRWAEIFQRQALDLEGIYPLIGSSAAALPEPLADPSVVVLDLQAGLLGTTKLRDGQAASIQIHHAVGPTPPSDKIFLDLLGTEDKSAIWLAGRGPRVKALAADLTHLLNREVRLIPVSAAKEVRQTVSEEALAGMAGAARNALRLAGAARTLPVPARDPAPPLWQRPLTYALAAAAALLLMIGSLEWFLGRMKEQAREAKEFVESEEQTVREQLEEIREREAEERRLQAEKKELESGVKRAEASPSKPRRELEEARQQRLKLQAEVAERLQKALTETKHLHTATEKTLPRRADLVPALLSALATVTSKPDIAQNISVDRITDAGAEDIRIVAWALSEASAQRFAQELGVVLQPWNLRVGDPHIRADKGRLGLPGYIVELPVGRTPP